MWRFAGVKADCGQVNGTGRGREMGAATLGTDPIPCNSRPAIRGARKTQGIAKDNSTQGEGTCRRDSNRVENRKLQREWKRNRRLMEAQLGVTSSRGTPLTYVASAPYLERWAWDLLYI